MKRAAFLLAVLAMFAGACSTDTTIDQAVVSEVVDDLENGDPDNSDTAPDPTAVPPASTDEPADEPADEPTAVPAPADEPDDEPDAPVATQTDFSDWCAAANAVEDNFEGLDLVDISDPEALEAAYTQAGQILVQVQSLAPVDIAPDIAVTLQGFGVLRAALEAAGWSFLDLDLSVMAELDGPMEIATFNIEKYNFENCGIDRGFDPADDPALRPETSGPDDDLVLEGTVREQAVQGLVDRGFAAEEANCLLERIDFTNPEAMADVANMLDVFTECGMSLDRLSQLGG